MPAPEVVKVKKEGQICKELGNLRVGELVEMTWPWPPALPQNRTHFAPYLGLIAYGVGLASVYRPAIEHLACPDVKEL